MTDRPILFSGPMVRALLAGTKTQTRRAFKGVEEMRPGYFHVFGSGGGIFCDGEAEVKHWAPSYLRIAVGDRLWVREAHAILPRTAYRASIGTGTIAQVEHPSDEYSAAVFREGFDRSGRPLWRPSIHMPRWASRLTLTVTDVRVERLQDCSETDAIAEGIERIPYEGLDPEHAGAFGWKDYSDHPHSVVPFNAEKTVLSYRTLWEAINGPGSWEANPWVAAYTFTVQHGNIDQVSP